MKKVDGSLFQKTKDCVCSVWVIGDEKHYIFYCTIDKLVDIRKDFVKELHESNLQSCFNDTAFSELTKMILKGTCRMKLDKIGKFLSAVLERTDAYYERPNESNRPLFYSFFDQVLSEQC